MTGMVVAFGKQIVHLSTRVLKYVEVFGVAVVESMHLALVMHRMMQISPVVGASETAFWVLRAFYRARLSTLAGVLHSYKIQ